MVQGCGDKCCKYIFLFVNLLVFIGGLACLGLGIWAAVDQTNFINTLSQIPSQELQQQNVPGLLQNSAYILIAAGALITLLSFLACCGAVRESKCMLGLYSGLVILFIILLLAAAIVGFIFRNEIVSGLQDNLIKGLQENYDGVLNSSDAFSRAIDRMQVEIECCGIKNYTEFRNATKWTVDHTPIPQTCCELKNKADFFNDLKVELVNPNCPTTLQNSYVSKPCYQTLYDTLFNKIAAVIGIALGILCLMILTVVFACCIIRAIDSSGKGNLG